MSDFEWFIACLGAALVASFNLVAAVRMLSSFVETAKGWRLCVSLCCFVLGSAFAVISLRL